MERAFGELLKRRLDIDEDQEGIVDQALKDIRKSMKDLKSVMADSRGDLADAFTGKEVDEASLAAVLGHQDDEVKRLRREIVFALKQIHAVLDSEQRELAVEWLRGNDWR